MKPDLKIFDENGERGRGEPEIFSGPPARHLVWQRRLLRRLYFELAINLLGAIIAAAVAIAITAAAARGAECYTDPGTGATVCDVEGTTSSIVRYAAADLEPPLPPGASGMTANGTCALVYDDGQRGILLTCGHNIRGTAPPHRVEIRPGQWVAARVLAGDLENELGALEIAGGTGIKPLEIYDGPLPADVHGCGYGGAADGFRLACVAGKVTNAAFTQTGIRGFTGCMRQGDSGGPVLSPDGRLVGVLWGNDNARGQVLFTCDQPLRRFLDQVLPGRPARIIPHYQPRPALQSTRPATNAGQQRPTLPAVSPVRPPALPMPPNIVEAPPARLPPPSVPPTYAPTPPPAPPAAIPPPPAPSVPPLTLPPAPATSDVGGTAPPRPSVYSPPANPPAGPSTGLLDRFGRAGIVKLLTFAGFGAGVAGLVAIPAWLLVKWAAKREAKKLRARLHPNQETSSVDTASAESPDATFHSVEEERSSTHEPLERDPSRAMELLQLRKLEGRDPVHDALSGRLLGARLEAIAESQTEEPAKRAWAKDLIHETDREFNRLAPAKFNVPNQ